MRALSALLVSYAFPPVGGAGVQRTAKLVKYLPEFGVTPSVLSVSNPSVPLRDETLMADIPSGTRIRLARTLEPGYATKQVSWKAEAGASARPVARLRGSVTGFARRLLVPDPQILWLPAASYALTQELLQHKPDCVLISAPPFSQFLLAPALRAARRPAIVLDYRDEWSTARNTYEMLKSGLARVAGEYLEERVLRAAHVITTATQEFRDNLLARFSFLKPDRVLAIPNGYDPDDFGDIDSVPPSDKLTLTYGGTIFKLTSAAGLLDAVRLLNERSPELGKLLSIKFFGRIVDTELPHFAGTEALGVERLGYIPHERVLATLNQSHVTLCLLDAVPGVEGIYPAKIFELMYLARPVLALAPEGALTRLMHAHNLGPVIAPRDVPAIANQLSNWLEAFRAGHAPERGAGYDPRTTARYHRRALAGEFAAALERARDVATGH